MSDKETDSDKLSSIERNLRSVERDILDLKTAAVRTASLVGEVANDQHEINEAIVGTMRSMNSWVGTAVSGALLLGAVVVLLHWRMEEIEAEVSKLTQNARRMMS